MIFHLDIVHILQVPITKGKGYLCLDKKILTEHTV